MISRKSSRKLDAGLSPVSQHAPDEQAFRGFFANYPLFMPVCDLKALTLLMSTMRRLKSMAARRHESVMPKQGDYG
jgi:hypothetical protein